MHCWWKADLIVILYHSLVILAKGKGIWCCFPNWTVAVCRKELLPCPAPSSALPSSEHDEEGNLFQKTSLKHKDCKDDKFDGLKVLPEVATSPYFCRQLVHDSILISFISFCTGSLIIISLICLKIQNKVATSWSGKSKGGRRFTAMAGISPLCLLTS